MLGNAPDYAAADTKDVKNYPTLFASMSDHASNNLKRGFKISTSHHYARPSRVEKGVPNVVGLNVREAIKLLEDAGLSVNFSGSGMVTSQSLAAGSQYARGQRIYLRLRNS